MNFLPIILSYSAGIISGLTLGILIGFWLSKPSTLD